VELVTQQLLTLTFLAPSTVTHQALIIGLKVTTTIVHLHNLCQPSS
jgi:hypothetical protein